MFIQYGPYITYVSEIKFFYSIYSIASSMDAWKTPICCSSWMLNWLPRDFSSLLSILFCKAVPGVGGTVWGVLKDKDSKRKGSGHGGDENKVSAAPSRSAWDPEKASTSSHKKSISLSLDVLQVSDTFCFLTYLLLCFILRSCSSEKAENIARFFVDYTRVIPFASFSASWAVVMCIQKEANMSAFGWSGLVRTRLVGGHFYNNKSEQYALELSQQWNI